MAARFLLSGYRSGRFTLADCIPGAPRNPIDFVCTFNSSHLWLNRFVRTRYSRGNTAPIRRAPHWYRLREPPFVRRTHRNPLQFGQAASGYSLRNRPLQFTLRNVRLLASWSGRHGPRGGHALATGLCATRDSDGAPVGRRTAPQSRLGGHRSVVARQRAQSVAAAVAFGAGPAC